MNNEYFILQLIIEALLVVIAGYSGKLLLYPLLLLNLLLIPIFGQKVVDIFGITTNGGNLFFATAMIALAILIEKYGKSELRNILGYSLFVMGGYASLSFISSYIVGKNEISEVINQVFSFSPRIMIASWLSFIASAWVFTTVFTFFKERFKSALMFRVLNSIIIAQFIDSVLFFSFAFWGSIPAREVAIMLLYGFLVKIAASIALIPVVYFGIKKKFTFKRNTINR